jgi:hypothetical protein
MIHLLKPRFSSLIGSEVINTASYSDLTLTSLESWLGFGESSIRGMIRNHPQPLLYCNLPRLLMIVVLQFPLASNQAPRGGSKVAIGGAHGVPRQGLGMLPESRSMALILGSICIYIVVYTIYIYMYVMQ